MQKIKVSVIVPIYNTEKFLRRCIDSIVNQSLKEIEIILINDGSIDSSHIICEEYSKKYPKKIRYINNKNIGCSASRNLGISLAQGEYIAFVDSDDYIDQEMYKEMYEKAKKENSDIVISGVKYKYIYTETIKIKESYPKNIKNKLDFLKPSNRIANCWNKLFKKELIQGNAIKFFEKIHSAEDLIFCFEIFFEAKRISHIEKSYYNYIHHGDNSVFNLEKRMEMFIAFKELYRYLLERNYIKDEKIVKKFYENFNFYAIRGVFFLLLNPQLVSEQEYKKYDKLFYNELKKIEFLSLNSRVLVYYYRSIVRVIRICRIYNILKKIKSSLKI